MPEVEIKNLYEVSTDRFTDGHVQSVAAQTVEEAVGMFRLIYEMEREKRGNADGADWRKDPRIVSVKMLGSVVV